MHRVSRRFGQFLAIALGSWLVVTTGLWILRGPTAGAALEIAVACTLAASVGVWWVSGRLPLSPTPWLILIGAHALVALLFGSFMITVTYALEAAASGTTLGDAARAARFLGAQFMFWIWLYVVLAAGSYALRVRDALRTEREAAARSEARLAEARLGSLRGQLNPHFLFNALHSVAALVQQDPQRAAEALERLGELLRFSLDEADEGLVALDDELRFTQTYLELVRLAMGERLHTTVEVEEQARDARVPPFSLQVLVENAVRHGVAPRPEGGAVTVRIRYAGDTVELLVENDGTESDASRGGKPGRGLVNLQARLDAVYGQAATLDATPRPGGGFRARILVPAA